MAESASTVNLLPPGHEDSDVPPGMGELGPLAADGSSGGGSSNVGPVLLVGGQRGGIVRPRPNPVPLELALGQLSSGQASTSVWRGNALFHADDATTDADGDAVSHVPGTWGPQQVPNSLRDMVDHEALPKWTRAEQLHGEAEGAHML